MGEICNRPLYTHTTWEKSATGHSTPSNDTTWEKSATGHFTLSNDTIGETIAAAATVC